MDVEFASDLHAGAGPKEEPSAEDEKPVARLEADLQEIQEALGRPEDLVVSHLLVAGHHPAALVYIDGLIDRAQLQEYVIRSLTADLAGQDLSDIIADDVLNLVRECAVPTARIGSSDGRVNAVIRGVLQGNVALLLDGFEQALLLNLPGGETRPIEEPLTESVVRGPRSGLTEVLRTNTALIRRIIASPALRMEELTLGRATQTKIVLTYLANVASPKLVEEARRRLSRIDIDGIVESHYIEELITDNPYSPFPQTSATERPDVVAASLLEGRVAILTSGTPFALVVPATFFTFLVSPEDYYQNPLVATFFRSLRFLAAFVSVFLPAIYVSVVSFHQAVIPTGLAFAIAAGREGTPFPALLESLGMLISFEILREAGSRLPRQLGQAMSIVGAMILGLAAVQARLIGPIMIFLIGITGITTFVIPSQAMVLSLRLLSFPMLFLGGTLGLLGVAAGFTILHVHLVSMRSFGVPYFAPLAPAVAPDQKDYFVRAPWWAMRRRPWFEGQRNPVREAEDLKPEPPRKTRGGKREDGDR